MPDRGERVGDLARAGQQHRRRRAEPRLERPHRDLLEIAIVEPDRLAVGDDRLLVRRRGTPSGTGPGRDSENVPVARSVICPSLSWTTCVNARLERLQPAR